ncbi:peptidoglycan DD-metalloendopeptidase family protein [Dactylosporangium sp. NPDC005555]|uniref:peptidoglycan DD-metalloendopeptidase family protein n=1 Tax=Dactylosporangium sp. NPDC005555 TaxID=3154889 RepID=UPI0033A3FF17
MRKIMSVAALLLAVPLLPAPAHAAQAATVVSPKRPLNVRAGSAVWTVPLRTLPHGSPVAIDCWVKGQLINQGSVRVTDQWDRLTDGSYVSDAWIRRSDAPIPACGAAAPVAPAAVAAAAAVTTTAGTVASGGTPLKARTAPAHTAPLIAALPNGTALTLVCQQQGENIAGTQRTTAMWNRLPEGTYVSDAYVRRAATPPPCTAVNQPVAAPAAPATGGEWTSPLPGFRARPGFRTANNPNHIGADIMSFTGTPIHAASAGTVTEVVCNIEAGHSCDQTGSPSIGGCGWYVKVQHSGGIATLYCHMVRKAIVQPGQKVKAGQVIGYVGSSGNSSAPHLHFEVHINAPPTGPQNAIDPIPFMRTHNASIG